jgi:hypothetical protein
MSGKIQAAGTTGAAHNNLVINPQYYYNVADKVQSARGACSSEKDLIIPGGPHKISNLLMSKDQNLRH